MIVIKPSQVVMGMSLLIPGAGAARIGGAGLKAVGSRIVARDLHKKAVFHGYKHGVSAAYAYFALEPLTPIFRDDKKLGIRYGSKNVVPMSTLFMGPLGMYRLPYMHKVPVPTFGYGFTAVPKSQSRLPGRSKSRGGEDATSTGTPRSTRTASKTIDGPLAKPNRVYPDRSRRGASATDRKGAGRPPKGKRRSRWNSEPVTPYCWRHNKRHFCKYTK